MNKSEPVGFEPPTIVSTGNFVASLIKSSTGMLMTVAFISRLSHSRDRTADFYYNSPGFSFGQRLLLRLLFNPLKSV